MTTTDQKLRAAVRLVAIFNLSYFGVEFIAALAIGSVSLFADSVDFLEDAAVNFLIFAAIGWSAQRRARVGMLLSAILLAPAVAFLWALWQKFSMPLPPEPISLSSVGLGALVVNLTCAFVLARFRVQSGSLTKAAFLSARNDAFANTGIIAAGLLTIPTQSIWPDLVVGIAIAALNIGAAREVWEAARDEHRASKPEP